MVLDKHEYNMNTTEPYQHYELGSAVAVAQIRNVGKVQLYSRCICFLVEKFVFSREKHQSVMFRRPAGEVGDSLQRHGNL